MAEEKCISKIRILNSEYNVKDEELREGIERLLGPIEVPEEELNTEANGD